MGLKTTDSGAEIQAIVTICDGTDVQRTDLLSKLTPDHFAMEDIRPMFERLVHLSNEDKPIPSKAIFSNDPSIPSKAREALDSATFLPCKTDEENQALIAQLDLLRRVRILYNGLKDVIHDVEESTHSNEELDRIMAKLEALVVNMRSGSEDDDFVIAGAGDNSEAVVEDILSDAPLDRIKTGFTKFDEAAGGLPRGDTLLCAATSGGGKSTMGNQMAQNSYLLDNRSVCVVSFEMDKTDSYSRNMSSLTQIPHDHFHLKKYEDGERETAREAWRDFVQHGKDRNIRFTLWCPSVEVTPNQIGQALRSAQYDLVIIDYVGLVGSDKQQAMWENLAEITRDFKRVAVRNKCAVVIMAQLDEDTGKVKYSKAMKHHASYVWTWVYGDEEAEIGEVTIVQKKTRHCRRFNFRLAARFDTMTFSNPGEETHHGGELHPPRDPDEPKDTSKPQPITSYAPDDDSDLFPADEPDKTPTRPQTPAERKRARMHQGPIDPTEWELASEEDE